MAEPVETLIAAAEAARADRTAWEGHWSDIQRFMMPNAMPFGRQAIAGETTRQDILDNTAELAGLTLAAAMFGILSNPQQAWFLLRIAGSDALNRQDAVARYLEDTGRRMRVVFGAPDSNFGAAMMEYNLQLVFFGTAALFIRERPGQMPLFQTLPLAETVLAENDENFIDTVYRVTELTARQAVQRFGEQAGTKTLEKAADPKKGEEKVKFLHIVAPRRDVERAKLDAANMAVASLWINLDEKHLARNGGFPEMPIVAGRWDRRPGEIYGRGPGGRALDDTRMLQRIVRATIRAAEQAVRPPLQVADDGVLAPVSLAEAAINVVRSDFLATSRRDAISPILTGARPDIGEDFSEAIRERIRIAFHNNLLLFNREARTTATQVIQEAEETNRVLGPVLTRQQPETLGPIVQRTYGILARQGALMDPPAEIEGRPLDVQYESPLARSQTVAEARAFAQTVELFAPVANVMPEVFDNQDFDTAYRGVAHALGQPLDWVRETGRQGKRGTVAEIRSARAETAKQQAQVENAAQIAEAAGAAAPALALLQGKDGGKPPARAA